MPINTNKLFPGEEIKPGEQLVSNNKQFILVYQADGNLVIRDQSKVPVPGGPADPTWVWDSGSVGHAPGRLAMQGDGNLHLYDLFGNPILRPNGTPFGTMTVSPTWKGTLLVLQDDGNLVLFGITPVFQSRTQRQLDPSLQPNPVTRPGAPNPSPAGSPNAIWQGIQDGLQVAEGVADVVSIVASLF